MGKRWFALAVVYACSAVLAFEIAGRVTYFSHHDLPLLSPASDLVYRFYPDLQDAVRDDPQGALRVLILGGSTLNRGFCDAESRLQEQLASWLGRDVRIVNLAVAAQGSLDSYYKYWYLRDRHFDLVVLYNGINELRANDVPGELRRDDYSHYAWYEEVNFLVRHYDLTRYGLVLPFYLQHQAVSLDRKIISRGRKVPYNSAGIRPEWMPFGASIKSAVPFRRNLERTLSLARAKREPVLLMTFAYAIPEEYSRVRFEQGALGYDRSKPGEPVEMWGRPEDIIRGLQVHNDIIREAANGTDVFFVDQDALMKHDPRNFIDVCHLSPAGSDQFVRHMVDKLKRQRFTMPRRSASSLGWPSDAS